VQPSPVKKKKNRRTKNEKKILGKGAGNPMEHAKTACAERTEQKGGSRLRTTGDPRTKQAKWK